jgi:hypothetical protein
VGAAATSDAMPFVLGMESSGMFNLTAVQKCLAEFGLDGWLLYDFRASNVLARKS